MLTAQEIKTFIDNDAVSAHKQQARTGWRYYKGDHDIKNFLIFFMDADGNYQIDKTKSNIKMCHPFFKILVDQEAQYVLSTKDSIFHSEIPELKKELDERFNNNDRFKAQLYATIIGCIAKGSEYMYVYKDKNGKTMFQHADGIGVVEVEARFASDKQNHILYWYVDRVDKDGKKIKRIQDWDKEQVVFYTQVDDGQIKLDPEAERNPRPHIVYTKDNDDALYYDTFGVIPFVRLDNNEDRESGLAYIKDQIDSYDLMNCGLANNIQDTNEALYVVKGFQGDNLDELLLNMKAKKHIGVDNDGGVEIHTIAIPYEARKIKMEIDEKNIFHFGMGVNTEAIKDTNATVSVQVKSAYANLDLKTRGFDFELREFFRNILDIVLDEINKENGKAYTVDDVTFRFDREFITNAQENAQIELTDAQRRQVEINTIMSLQTVVGDDTRLRLIAEQLDIDYDELKADAPTPEDDINSPYVAKQALAQVPPEEPAEGDLIE